MPLGSDQLVLGIYDLASTCLYWRHLVGLHGVKPPLLPNSRHSPTMGKVLLPLTSSSLFSQLPDHLNEEEEDYTPTQPESPHIHSTGGAPAL